ncbi:MAG TPA: hypothetical protein PLZ24_15550 [Flavobacteriales bacterium]|nr:hypothetical protein [Flavobacteriales bacterium]
MATPTYLTKPTTAIEGDDQVPTLNLKKAEAWDGKNPRNLRQHSPYGNAANSYNENTIVTDKAVPVEYWVRFSYFGTSDTCAWRFPTLGTQTSSMAAIDAELGIDVNS